MRPKNLLKRVGKVALGAGKVTVSALQTTGNATVKAGKFTVSTLQNLDKTVKASIIARIPQEMKEAIKQGKIAIPRAVIRTALREYLLEQKVTLVDLSLKPNQCLIVATTQKLGIIIKAKVAVDIEELEVKLASSEVTSSNLPEADIKLIVVEPLKISGEGFFGATCIWIVEKIGMGILGINLLPKNLRDFQVAGSIIAIPIKALNFESNWQNYFKYLEYVKEVKFVDNAVELTLAPPQWVLEMLTEEEQSPPV